MYIYVYMILCMCVHMCIFVGICMFTCTMYMRVMYVGMLLCICVWMHMMYLYLFVPIQDFHGICLYRTRITFANRFTLYHGLGITLRYFGLRDQHFYLLIFNRHMDLKFLIYVCVYVYMIIICNLKSIFLILFSFLFINAVSVSVFPWSLFE